MAENEGFKLKEKNGSVLLQTHREEVFKKGSSYQIHLTNFPFSGALKGAAEKGQNAISWKVTSLDPCAFLYFHPLLFYYLSLFFLFVENYYHYLSKLYRTFYHVPLFLTFPLTFLPNVTNFTILFCPILE